MGKKSGPTAPPPPDPVATAQAQGEMNVDTAIAQANLNRVNQVTPQGSITYNQIGTNADGTPQYEQVMSYSPEQQALYDQQNQIAQALGGLAGDNISRVADAQSTPFNFDGMQPLQGINFDPSQFQTSLNTGPGPQMGYDTGGGIQSTFSTGGPLTSDAGAFAYQNQIADAGDVTRSVGGDYSGAVQQASDAVYNQLASRLDPQYAQLERQMRDRLVNSGISENSEAFRREMDNFARSRTDAYGSAANQSVLTGLAAQQQGFGQDMANANLNNAAQAQVFGQNAAQLGAFNQAQQAGFDQSFANANLNNAAQGQQYTQNLGAAAFGNDAQQQQNQQNAQQAAFANTAQDQQFQQALAAAGFGNAALGQQLGAETAVAGVNNDIRQRQIEEAAYLRNMPLNDIAALLGTGGGVQAPTFGPVSQVGLNSPDLMGATYNTYNAQMNQYNQQQQARSGMLGSIFGLAGSALPLISDRRLKYDIKRIGKLANGIATYSFKYIGSKARQFGVMAQEVLNIKPEAVGTVDGYYYVDYSKVYG